MIRTPMLYVIAQFALFGIFFITYWTLPGSSTGILPTIGGISVAVAFAVLAAAGYEHLARNRSLPNITPHPAIAKRFDHDRHLCPYPPPDLHRCLRSIFRRGASARASAVVPFCRRVDRLLHFQVAL